MAQSYANDTQRPPMTRIKEGFEIIFISNYHMHNYATYLRGRVPLQWIQPVQVCRSQPRLPPCCATPRRLSQTTGSKRQRRRRTH